MRNVFALLAVATLTMPAAFAQTTLPFDEAQRRLDERAAKHQRIDAENVAQRIERLEEENTQLRAELAQLRGLLARSTSRAASAEATPNVASVVGAETPRRMTIFQSGQAVLDAIPKEFRAEDNAYWAGISKDLAEKWLNENVVGAVFRGKGTYITSSLLSFEKPPIVSASIENPFKFIGQQGNVTIEASFPSELAQSFLKMKSGQDVFFAGSIREVRVSTVSAGKLEVTIRATDCRLQEP